MRNPYLPAASRQAGLTLLELIIVLVIATQVAWMASANWRSITERTTAFRVQTDISTAFRQARSEAVTKGTITTLCPLDENNRCTAAWDSEVTLFLDPANQKALTPQGRKIKEFKLSPTGNITASNSGPAQRRYFQYNPDGSMKGTIGNLLWCPPSGEEKRAMQARINFGGRLTWAQDSNDDGVREDANGAPLVCN